MRRASLSLVTLVLGVSVSVTLAVILYFASSVSLIDSFLVGLLGTVITILIDISGRLASIERDATFVFNAGKFAERIREIAQASGEISRNYGGRLPELELLGRYQRIAGELEELRNGRIRSSGGDYLNLLKACDQARSEILAVTNVYRNKADGLSWWDSEVGRTYWEGNRAALKRGVRITRVAIVESISSMDPAISAFLAIQETAGVEVRVIESRAVDPTLHFNIALIDGLVAWEARSNAQGIQYENVVSYASSDVARIRHHYEILETSSSRHRPRPSIPEPG